MTTAAITSNSRPVAEDGIAALRRPVRTSPAKPLRPPAKRVDQHLHSSDVDARETRSFAVSADRVHFVAEDRVGQNKMHDREDDHRNDDRDRDAEQGSAAKKAKAVGQSKHGLAIREREGQAPAHRQGRERRNERRQAKMRNAETIESADQETDPMQTNHPAARANVD